MALAPTLLIWHDRGGARVLCCCICCVPLPDKRALWVTRASVCRFTALGCKTAYPHCDAPHGRPSAARNHRICLRYQNAPAGQYLLSTSVIRMLRLYTMGCHRHCFGCSDHPRGPAAAASPRQSRALQHYAGGSAESFYVVRIGHRRPAAAVTPRPARRKRPYADGYRRIG